MEYNFQITEKKNKIETVKPFQFVKKINGGQVSNPSDIATLIRNCSCFSQEQFYVVFMTTAHTVITVLISMGTLNKSLVHPRDIFREAIKHDVASLILAHTHPSGNVTPSPEDEMTTNRLVEAGELMGIHVIDHVIVGSTNKYFSFQENGKIKG